ncbi:Acyl carrier protein [compost metagenome]
MKTVQERVAKLIAEQFGIPESEVTPEKKLEENFGADSLDAVEVMMAVEDEFGFDVPDDELGKFQSVQDIQDYVAQRLR